MPDLQPPRREHVPDGRVRHRRQTSTPRRITPRTAAFGEAGRIHAHLQVHGRRRDLGPGRRRHGRRSSRRRAGSQRRHGPSYELPTVAVDPGAGTGGADRVYVAARDTTGFGNSGPPCPSASCPGSWIAVSNDGGATCGAPVQASAPGVPTAGGQDRPAQPVIGADHSVSTAYRVSGGTAPVHFVRSTDAGQTWSRPGDDRDRRQRQPCEQFARDAGGVARARRSRAWRSTRPTATSTSSTTSGPPARPAPLAATRAPTTSSRRTRTCTSSARSTTARRGRRRSDRRRHTASGRHDVQTRHPNIEVAPNGRVDIVWQDRRHWYQGPGERNCVHTHIRLRRRPARRHLLLLLDGRRRRRSPRTGASATARTTTTSATTTASGPAGPTGRCRPRWAATPSSSGGWTRARAASTPTPRTSTWRRCASTRRPRSRSPRSSSPTPVALSVALSKHAYEGGGEGVLSSTFATRNGTRAVIVNQDDTAGGACRCGAGPGEPRHRPAVAGGRAAGQREGRGLPARAGGRVRHRRHEPAV